MAEPTSTSAPDDRRGPGKRPSSRRMRPGTRKVWLLLHVAISVGWFGGAYAMLVMGVAATTSAGEPLRPAAYELMHLSDRVIMIPGSLGALVTGLVLALRTKWRVLHHWWVVLKLVLTVGGMAFAYACVAHNVRTALAATEHDPAADIGALPANVVSGSAVMLVVLFVITLLSVLKPWGRTRWGRAAARDAARRGAVAPIGRAGAQELGSTP
ncbi:hypothetical protein [Saccharothrix coeruleofusca]|nr:hypothetical protein [Saccharothrix coeruleofusca]